MRSERTSLFGEGLRAAFPVAVGYFPIAVAFGLLARSAGVPGSGAMALSVFVYAGASQFVAVNLMGLGASVAEIVLAVFVLNFRHFLMSSTLARRIAPGTSRARRALLAFGVTDETYAVASLRPEEVLSPAFLLGLNLFSYLSWVAGSFVGFFLASSLPDVFQKGMAIALYAMFIGLLVPSACKDRRVLVVALLSMAVNGLYRVSPLAAFGGGWGVLTATVAAALIGVRLFSSEAVSR
ncbi:MAG: AzlC family ABC transporter permease [Synergistaceae bacterium]|nr:AzlC family ABC transporter permease [Synergistaceae bacterium]